MSAFPGPAALGRGVLVPAGHRLHAKCRQWPRVVIDEAVLANPGPVADRLHEHWLRRRPCVVVLAVDAASLRAPERCEREVWEMDEGFEFVRERLQYLAWSNNYDL